MVTSNKKLKQQKVVRYLNKDFDGFRSDLLEYAKAHFSDVITDFSDTSVGGMFLDFTAYVGDVTSHYLDHQFNELFIDTAREPKNIKRIAKQLGLKPQPATPSVVYCTFFIDSPVVIDKKGNVSPDTTSAFILKAGTTVESDSGVVFELLEDIDFSIINDKNEIQISERDSSGEPTKAFIKKRALCISGERKTFSITIPNKFVRFRKVELPDVNVTQIISVVDSDENEFFGVDYLTQDTVFEAVKNETLDKDDVPFIINIKPATYRYTAEYDFITEKTTLTFGSGKADTIDDDIVPDPSEFAIPLYGKTTLTRFSINPEQFLQTKTMGVAPMGTTLKINTRVGGGLAHNVAERTINSLKDTLIAPLSTNATLISTVIQTLDVTNFEEASGGDEKQTVNELKQNASANFASQSRLVTKEDYIARIYSMPASFGRVYRAFVRTHENANLSIQVHILSRNSDGTLTISPDSLKKNLKTFIGEYKMLTDSVDILDADIINMGIDFNVVVSSKSSRVIVLNNILKRLNRFFNIENFQIGQPIIIDEVKSLIYNTEGVIAVADLKFNNLTDVSTGNIDYSQTTFSVTRNTNSGIILCPENSIFEIKFPNKDIRGAAV